MAGSGLGSDGAKHSEAERTRWRQQARHWLRLDLADWKSRLNAATPKIKLEIQKRLAHWRDDSDLAGLRDPAALNQLPLGERQGWRALWSDMEALLASAPLSK